MSLQLRPYQIDLEDQVRAAFQQDIRQVMVQSPTGSGKTALTANMLGTAASRGMDCWFVVHRRELIIQSIRAFSKIKVRHGVMAAGFIEDTRHKIQLGSIQTLASRFNRLRKPRFIVWDEAHHIAAASWEKIFRWTETYKPEIPTYHVGLSATPERLDGRGLAKYFRKMVKGPSVSWLIDEGYLAPYRLLAPPGIVVDGVTVRMGDFVNSELSKVIDRPTITGNVIGHYRKYADGKRAIVFCVSVEHSKHVTEQFNAAGIPAAHVDGGTNRGERDQSILDFEAGKIKVLSNVELFGEGFDLPALEVAILLRPTHSLGLYLQQVGRALRPSPDKDCAIILDHAGNCARHGLPDEDRAWSLEGRKKKAGSTDEPTIPVRICPKCFAAQRGGKLVCGYCGHTFEIDGREIEEIEGDLQELNVFAVREERKKEERDCTTLEELVELGERRKYPNAIDWAFIRWKKKQAFIEKQKVQSAKLAGVRP